MKRQGVGRSTYDKSKYLVTQIFGMFQTRLFQKITGVKIGNHFIPCRTNRRKSTLPTKTQVCLQRNIRNESKIQVDLGGSGFTHQSCGLLKALSMLPELILVVLKPYIVYLTVTNIYIVKKTSNNRMSQII